MKILAFTGLAGSGKTTAALYMASRHGYEPLSFADPMKKMLTEYLTVVGVSPSHAVKMVTHSTLKETAHWSLNNHTPRRALQTLGTEWARTHLGDDFWINAMEQRMIASKSDRFVIDDVRFENEAAMVRRLGGKVVRIERPGLSQGAHVSEAGVEPDLTYHNLGTPDDMRAWLEYHYGT